MFADDGLYPAKGYLYDGSTAPHGLRLVHGLRFVVGLSYPQLLGTSYSPRPRDGETSLHTHDDMLDKAKRTLLDYAVVLTTDDASEAPIVRHAGGGRGLYEVLPVRAGKAEGGRMMLKRNLSAVVRSLFMERNGGHLRRLWIGAGPASYPGGGVVLGCGCRGRPFQKDARPKRTRSAAAASGWSGATVRTGRSSSCCHRAARCR